MLEMKAIFHLVLPKASGEGGSLQGFFANNFCSSPGRGDRLHICRQRARAFPHGFPVVPGRSSVPQAYSLNACRIWR
jgi:hypothetical protein